MIHTMLAVYRSPKDGTQTRVQMATNRHPDHCQGCLSKDALGKLARAYAIRTDPKTNIVGFVVDPVPDEIDRAMVPGRRPKPNIYIA